MRTSSLVLVSLALALAGCAGQAGDEETDVEASAEQALAAAPASVTLKIDWQRQSTGYWCGPASSRIALSSKLASPPSQQTLATYEHTTVNGTDDISYVSRALNAYLHTGEYSPRYISGNPTAAQTAALKQALVATLSNGLPMVGNIVSGWRPPFYPGGTIYHYIAIVGYDQSGNRALIADPAGKGYAGTGWDKVPATYYVSTTDLAVWIGGKGYAATSLPIKAAPPPPDHKPVGSLDAATASTLTGWAQDPDARTTALPVHLYFDGVAGKAGVVNTSVNAALSRADLCKPLGSCTHAFSISTPRRYCDGKAHLVHAYAMDTAKGPAGELTGSPRSFTCAAPALTGIRRHLLSYTPWGLSAFYDTRPESDATVNKLAAGADFPNSVALIRATGDAAIYLVDGQSKRHVTSTASAAAWHLNLKAVKTVSKAQLDAYATGAALPAAPLLIQGSASSVWVVDAAPPAQVAPKDGGTAVIPPLDGGTEEPTGPGVDEGTDGGVNFSDPAVPDDATPKMAGAQGCNAGAGGAMPLVALALVGAWVVSRRR